MLLELGIRNFRCFRDAARLSLIASSDTSLPANVLADSAPAAERVLSSVAIYGPNASGKSTVLKALGYMRRMVTRSAATRVDASIPFAEAFRLDPASEAEPTEFEVVFTHRGTRYQYGFAVRPERVVSEWLFGASGARQKRYYERVWSEEARSYTYRFGPALKGQREKLKELTRDNALYLSTGATLNHDLLTEVYSWFSTQVKELKVSTLSLPALADFMQLKPENRALISGLLGCADTGITDLSIEQVEVPGAPGETFYPRTTTWPSALAGLSERDRRRFRVEVHHRRSDGGEAIFGLDRESDGTRRLLLTSPHVLGALQSGGVVLIDEIDSSLHPLITRALVAMFHDQTVNVGKAQLVCTTHDTSLLDTSLLRRDQVWFTERDGTGSSHLYSLLEYRPRKDAAIGRGYLAGRYGAIPLVVSPLLSNLCAE